ncbi:MULTISPECIES: hypothetical protein [unclassified Lactococcus]|uniref:hypothetical protein n=1 Tax=unclassified Lactococcus TaxID=2643510 RepID=UPI0011CAF9E2|nr:MULTISPECIES: hypothetical protein [unclassified Lactococcus]MQW22958.1 hypothetical protein [Lactococcus sp. dk101]TXK44497.1 hypothetical protein FVP42_04385 [Lactococcus sp. dk310]TXK50350.1 hypothetical protein FVP43_04355 [Lactococcus sp. dk322]
MKKFSVIGSQYMNDKANGTSQQWICEAENIESVLKEIKQNNGWLVNECKAFKPTYIEEVME